VKLDRFHVVLGRNPLDARMVLRTPVSDPDVDAQVKGTVDLADVRKTVKLEGVSQLAGTVSADASVRTRMSYLDKKQYDKVAAKGNVDVRGLTVQGKALPHPLAIQQASLALAPERAQLKSFAGSVGSSDLQATGTLENLLGYALKDDVLRGTATVHSNKFNLDEWRSREGDLQIIEVPPKIDFGLTATIAELTYDKLKATNARGRLRIKDQRVTLEDFRMNALGGEMVLSGYYETTNPAKPRFDIALKLNQVDIPSTFQTFATVQALAPVAKFATGKVTTEVRLNGELGKNMMPLLAGLSGRGSLQTSQLALHDFPAMNKLADVTKLQFLNNPTLQPVNAKFQVQGGRLNVQPFAVKLGPTTMKVAGSNGLDQSLDYNLGLSVPRSALGGAANQAIAGLVSKAGQAGINLNAAPEIPLDIQLGGTVTNPSISVGAGNVASSATAGAQQAVREAATEKASAAASQLVQEAEARAQGIRQDAQALAEKVKAEGYRQADSITAKAGSNPLLQAAAKPAADRIRKQSDDKAAGIVAEANRRADSLVAAARRQAGDTASKR
ncbi:MAG TPA: AsmA-like C-terminal region-containing protein, partial [Gemmatimonadales bacterium]|nr:AsmA-like C-terminal region-containing protein [Gemmatimonadales bacterium]